MRESIPRQVDKKPGVPKEEKGIWNSQGGGKGKYFFFPLYIPESYSHKKFFTLNQELMITQQTIQFKLCTNDYIATMYPA